MGSLLLVSPHFPSGKAIWLSRRKLDGVYISMDDAALVCNRKRIGDLIESRKQSRTDSGPRASRSPRSWPSNHSMARKCWPSKVWRCG